MALSTNNLLCKYNGKNVTVVITNDGAKYETVAYECVYRMDNGSTHSIAGSAGLSAGESKEVANNTLPAPVVSVEAKSIIDE